MKRSATEFEAAQMSPPSPSTPPRVSAARSRADLAVGTVMPPASGESVPDRPGPQPPSWLLLDTSKIEADKQPLAWLRAALALRLSLLASHPQQVQSGGGPTLQFNFSGAQRIVQAEVAALGIAAFGVHKPVLHAQARARYSSSPATGVVSLVSDDLS